MSMIGGVLKELLGMFLGDARLTGAVLCLVAAVGILSWSAGPFVPGAILLIGCLAILVEAAFREARKGAAND